MRVEYLGSVEVSYCAIVCVAIVVLRTVYKDDDSVVSSEPHHVSTLFVAWPFVPGM